MITIRQTLTNLPEKEYSAKIGRPVRHVVAIDMLRQHGSLPIDMRKERDDSDITRASMMAVSYPRPLLPSRQKTSR